MEQLQKYQMLLYLEGNGRYCDRHGCLTPVTVTDRMIYMVWQLCKWLKFTFLLIAFCNFFLDICYLFEQQLYV